MLHPDAADPAGSQWLPVTTDATISREDPETEKTDESTTLPLDINAHVGYATTPAVIVRPMPRLQLRQAGNHPGRSRRQEIRWDHRRSEISPVPTYPVQSTKWLGEGHPHPESAADNRTEGAGINVL